MLPNQVYSKMLTESKMSIKDSMENINKSISKNKNTEQTEQLTKKIRKKKSKNNDHLLVRRKEYTTKPIILWQPQQYQYHLFNDIVIDFELIRCPQSEQKLNRGLLWSTFKSVPQVNILNDGSMMEWIQENINQPMLNTKSLIQMLLSLSSKSAYLLSVDLNIVNEYRLLLSSILSKMNAEQRINLFAQRRAYSIAKSNELISKFSRNQISIFYEFLYNDKQQTHEYRRMGFSKKLLSLAGIDIKDAPSILLRRGFIDICSKQQQALFILKRNVLPQFSRNMPEVTEFQMETEQHTLEGIPYSCILHIRVYNTAYKFDHDYCLDLPIKPDTLTEINIEIPRENILKIYEIRRQLNLFTKYSLDDFVNGEFQYLVQVENFLEKYYTSPYSYRKNKRENASICQQLKDNKEAGDVVFSETTIIKNNTENNIPFENDLSHSSENLQDNQQQQYNSNSSFTEFNHKQTSQKNQIHPSISNIKQTQDHRMYDEAFCPDGENIYINNQKFDSPELFIKEYEYNHLEARILSNETLNLGTY